MREIQLTRGFVTLVDDSDYERVVAVGPWYPRVRINRYTVYAIGWFMGPDGRRIGQLLHTFLTGYPRTDHRDGNGLNNQRANLRPATQTQNQGNALRPAHNTSGYKGVTWRPDRRCWRAQIKVNDRMRRLGHYGAAEDAARAYDEAAREIFGEFACVNFPIANERSALTGRPTNVSPAHPGGG
jgi:hypothetical protein